MKVLPLTVNDLIEELDKLFPDKCAKPEQDIREIMYYAGQRSVVNHLLARKNNEDMFYNISEDD